MHVAMSTHIQAARCHAAYCTPNVTHYPTLHPVSRTTLHCTQSRARGYGIDSLGMIFSLGMIDSLGMIESLGKTGSLGMIDSLGMIGSPCVCSVTHFRSLLHTPDPTLHTRTSTHTSTPPHMHPHTAHAAVATLDADTPSQRAEREAPVASTPPHLHTVAPPAPSFSAEPVLMRTVPVPVAIGTERDDALWTLLALLPTRWVWKVWVCGVCGQTDCDDALWTLLPTRWGVESVKGCGVCGPMAAMARCPSASTTLRHRGCCMHLLHHCWLSACADSRCRCSRTAGCTRA